MNPFPRSVLLHIPHASAVIPAKERKLFCVCDAALEDELLKMTDRYTDILFGGACDAVVFPVSRLVCDPERFRSDANEPMARVGMGAVYSHSYTGQRLRTLTDRERERILRQYYDLHHEALTKAVERKLRKDGSGLIVDCHSFSPYPLPHEPDLDPARPDFCIGTDSFHTPAALTNLVCRFLSARGHSVAINAPFAGTIVPLSFYQKDPRVWSIMIEVNRGLYMDDQGLPRRSFSYVRDVIQSLLLYLQQENMN